MKAIHQNVLLYNSQESASLDSPENLMTSGVQNLSLCLKCCAKHHVGHTTHALGTMSGKGFHVQGSYKCVFDIRT